MYCQYCGAQLTADARFCHTCGKPTPVGIVAAAATAPAVLVNPEEALSRTLQTLAILWGIYSGFRVLMTIWVVVAGQVFLPLVNNVLAQMPQHIDAYPFFRFVSGMIAVTAFFSVATGALGLWAAWALWKHDSSGRIVALVAAAISLINVPFGTALGIYTMVVLLPEGRAESYARLGAPAKDWA